MKFSPAQERVLRTLDGATAPVEFGGTAARTIESLRKMGLVTVRKGRKSARTYYYPDATTLVLYVSLTREGSDLFYNGGMDH